MNLFHTFFLFLVSDELKNEQEKFKSITNELETTFSEMTGY